MAQKPVDREWKGKNCAAAAMPAIDLCLETLSQYLVVLCQRLAPSADGFYTHYLMVGVESEADNRGEIVVHFFEKDGSDAEWLALQGSYATYAPRHPVAEDRS